jgi:hypothetical protein
MRKIIVVTSVLILGACSSISSMIKYTPPRYTVSEENQELLKKVGHRNINVHLFTKTAEFDNSCRVVAGIVQSPDKTGFEGYIRKAFINELKQADMFDDSNPKVSLTGVVEKLSLSTGRITYLSNWEIGIRLSSSNGKSVYIFQHYDFNAGDRLLPDCQMIADNYMQAVQKTLGKLIDSPEFESLVTP